MAIGVKGEQETDAAFFERSTGKTRKRYFEMCLSTNFHRNKRGVCVCRPVVSDIIECIDLTVQSQTTPWGSAKNTTVSVKHIDVVRLISDGETPNRISFSGTDVSADVRSSSRK